MKKSFFAPLTEYVELAHLRELMKKKRFPLRVSGCIDGEKCHLASFLAQDYRATLIVAANDLKAKEIYSDYRLFDKDVCYYPAKDIIFYSADIRGNALVRERMQTLKKLASGERVTVITSIDAGLDRLLPLESLKDRIITIEETDTIDLPELEDKLTYLGYSRQSQVETAGEFAVRGGIIDVFPLSEEAPFRIELWGDEVDSIRIFDVESQRSLDRVDRAVIFPAAELAPEKDVLERGVKRIDESCAETVEKLRAEFKTEVAHRLSEEIERFKEDLEYLKGSIGLDSFIRFFYDDTVSFFDYFSGEDCLVILDEPARALEKIDSTMTEFGESMKGRLMMGYILPLQAEAVYSKEEMFASLSATNVLMLSTLDYRFAEISAKEKIDIEVRSVNSYNGNFELLCGELAAWKKKGYRTVLVCPSHSKANRLAEDLRDHDLISFFSEEEDREVSPGEILVTYGNISKGFEYPLIKFAIISESDIFGVQKKKKPRKLYEGSKIANYSDLTVGDYVVHETYGIGIYRGIEKIEVERIIKDYIKVEYAGGGTLYVLASSMGLLQKYAGGDSKAPKLNRLDGPEWKNTKTRVRSAVREIAGELVKLYALRQQKEGFAFSKDCSTQTEFEELFQYAETDDQLRAIEETKADMESTKIMDRLICGDVGYGKTEIAIRAAFKAVMDGKQVAFLVPTTILAQQHYNTFVQRMRDFAVNIEMLSRFRTAAEQKKIIEKVNHGQIDILIGTHRILSGDISFRNLGLLIVDEEQRFGVTHKERIKQMKGDVDVLTLTATPIPRTLHMSLIGIRDMSVLDEPPVDRLPIQTFVMEHNDEMIREAINREMSRGGQVYYVYNRVRGIDEIAAQLQRLVPEANVVYAHGQMNERELERIMMSFINGEIDVLVSTTIIETGLDISNVNTIIIDDADKLGLSQLYQLRGRVGRSARTAYAFLMFKRDRILKEVAEKRLAAIREYTELGSGFKIAMRDLEIRGAGNLLGAEQSGHMEAVGYDLYCKLLNDAVKTMKGDKEPEEEYDTTIDMDMDAYIPSTYIKNEGQKLAMYKRIACIETEAELKDMEDELVDRYGEYPACVDNLLHIALTKALGHQVYATSIVHKKLTVTIMMFPRAKIDGVKLFELITAYKGRLKFNQAPTPRFEFALLPTSKEKKAGGKKARLSGESALEQLSELFKELKNICFEKE